MWRKECQIIAQKVTWEGVSFSSNSPSKRTSPDQADWWNHELIIDLEGQHESLVCLLGYLLGRSSWQCSGWAWDTLAGLGGHQRHWEGSQPSFWQFCLSWGFIPVSKILHLSICEMEIILPHLAGLLGGLISYCSSSALKMKRLVEALSSITERLPAPAGRAPLSVCFSSSCVSSDFFNVSRGAQCWHGGQDDVLLSTEQSAALFYGLVLIWFISWHDFWRSLAQTVLIIKFKVSLI